MYKLRKMILNLDSQFNPFPGQPAIEFDAFTFSGGEPHIKIKSDLSAAETVMITHRLTSFNEVGLLLIAIDAVRRCLVEEIHVFIPYFPAARQDRVMVAGESLSVKVYADLFNQLRLKGVIVYDPHSEVTPALLDNCVTVSNFTFIERILKDLPKDTLLVAPDGGALKKIYKLAAYLKDYNVIECGKTRDVKTGKLSGFKVYANDLEGRACLVVDDICDGGGTFMGLAGELKKAGAGDLYLAVSHGIFSKGTEKLSEHFRRLYTTDSFRTIVDDAVEQLPLGDLL